MPAEERPKPGSIVVLLPGDREMVESALGISLGMLPIVGTAESVTED
jgi:hypothetical protein